MADTKTSATQEKELSMDEILSSIRSIITEDQETRSENKRTFSPDSTTNPSGARQLSDIPKFDKDDDFQLPNFYEQKKEVESSVKAKQQEAVFPEETFDRNFVNETSFQERQAPYFDQKAYSRNAHVDSETKETISSALKDIVASYAQRAVSQAKQESSEAEQGLSAAGSSRLNEMINLMIEKIVVVRIEEWLHKNLSGILENAILRELERVLTQMKI